MSEPLYVDNSILSAMECDTKVLMSYALGRHEQAEVVHLRGGSAGHEALAEYLRTGDVEKALAKLAEVYKGWSAKHVKADNPWRWEQLHAIVWKWCTEHPIETLPWRAYEGWIESTLQFPLVEDGSIVFVGKPDVLGADMAGMQGQAHVFVDHKFTGSYVDNEYWKGQFESSSQVSGYLWLLGKVTQQPVTGFLINAIEVRKLPDDPTRGCKKHGVKFSECGLMHANSTIVGPLHRDPWRLEEWHRNAVRLARRYESLKKDYPSVAEVVGVGGGRGEADGLLSAGQQGRFFGRSCGFCEYESWCNAGRPVHYAEAAMVERKWEPWRAGGEG